MPKVFCYNLDTNETEICGAFLNGECDLPVSFFRDNPQLAGLRFFAADGGADLAVQYGITPELVLGDMDSLSPATRKMLGEAGCRFEVFPTDKDKTDGELLLEKLEEMGFARILLFAATGNRIDQTLINIQLLGRFTSAAIVTAEELLFCTSKDIVFNSEQGKRISFIVESAETAIISLCGCQYELAFHQLRRGSSFTISNKIVAERAVLSVHQGTVMVIKEL